MDEWSIEARIGDLEMKVSQMEGRGGSAEEGICFGPENGEWMVPGGGAADRRQFAWNASLRQIGAGVVTVGRLAVSVEASETELEDGTYWVKVTFGAQSDAAEIYEGAAPQATDDVTYLPLYVIDGGKVAQDMRGAFYVQCWER